MALAAMALRAVALAGASGDSDCKGGDLGRAGSGKYTCCSGDNPPLGACSCTGAKFRATPGYLYYAVRAFSYYPEFSL
jgi:hypothetical protein